MSEYLTTINRLLSVKHQPLIAIDDITGAANQLKAMIDLCHLYGIAVILDVVYNHAGGFDGDDESLYFWDRAVNGNNNNSLYFTDQGWAGGLAFALWNGDVRQFLINNAAYYLRELHVDGFRYDEVSVLVNKNALTGWSFCQDLSSTLRFLKPRAIQNAEFWPVNADVVKEKNDGGAGFDVTQHDGLRESVRKAIGQAAAGHEASVDFDRIAANLYPPGFQHAWQAITCIENHDIVKVGEGSRIATLADGSNQRSWYACSRSRVAQGLLLTAPGIPMLFMGEELLENKQWSDDPDSGHLINWKGLGDGDKPIVDYLRFSQELIRLRWRQPALRSDSVRVFHVHNQNRIIALHRWLEGAGRDVIVVASLNESTFHNYAIGFPSAGHWLEVFNSDVYQNWVNPGVAGNGGSVNATSQPMHGFAASCSIVVPANSIVVFARDVGD
ncbi:MAG: alpha amylase C-terminal domain-containing protein [Deltaproteobacteria bacterium]|nr:alpha amylase C-terminal domain-containing protein [Deltaproteobacteria bacterium]